MFRDFQRTPGTNSAQMDCPAGVRVSTRTATVAEVRSYHCLHLLRVSGDRSHCAVNWTVSITGVRRWDGSTGLPGPLRPRHDLDMFSPQIPVRHPCLTLVRPLACRAGEARPLTFPLTIFVKFSVVPRARKVVRVISGSADFHR